VARSTYVVGKAGHLAAMAEFLLRGYNVAMPEADEGDDIFVIEDQSGELWRVQVKTAIGRHRRTGWRAKYSISFDQIKSAKTPEMFFVFVLRRESTWEFLVIRRKALLEEVEDHQVGSRSLGNVLLTITFHDSAVLCSGRDWQAYRDNWSEWPLIEEK
jgi:hypothetical protein